MTNRSHQETLSVRISQTLWRRMTGIQGREASRLGHAVSLSNVAKCLLAAARGPDVEVAELLSDPTGALLTVRRKRAAELPLTPAEWTVVAHFAQQGMESIRHGLGPVPSRLVVGVLDAFLAVHELRSDASAWDVHYLENLPLDCQLSRQAAGRAVITDMSRHVREVVAATRRHLADGETSAVALRAGRNLHLLLANDRVAGAEVINQALSPHWSTLWPLAARGHYALAERPVRATSGSFVSSDITVPFVLRDGGMTVSCACGAEICVSVTFPGPIVVEYPLFRYPVVREFRQMVAALAANASWWEGAWFRGYVVDDGICFRALANGITVGCHREDWGRLHGLLQQAWKMMDVEVAWERLGNEYGEL